MHPVQIGACGWSYRDWSEVFYPKKMPAAQYLAHYAEHYRVVEVDSTFYHAPSRKTVEGWRDKTPAGFGFSLKVPQSITHEKILVDCQAEVDSFLAAARVLEEKLLCCVLQFGYFNRTKFDSGEAFLERLAPFLDIWPADVRVAVEIRNKTWITPTFLDALRSQGVVRAHGSGLDAGAGGSPTEFRRHHRPVGILALLGDRVEVDKLTTTLDHVVIDRIEQIRLDALAIKLLQKSVPVLVFVNNHFAGYATSNHSGIAGRTFSKSPPISNSSHFLVPALAKMPRIRSRLARRRRSAHFLPGGFNATRESQRPHDCVPFPPLVGLRRPAI